MPSLVRYLIVVFVVGSLGGVLSFSFLYCLSKVTSLREANPILIFGLPFYGLIFGLLIKKIPHHINQGVGHLFELVECKDKEGKVSGWMIPFIFFSSLGTHLFGGSAGREGVGVIMGASAGEGILGSFVKFSNMRKTLLYAGAAAGFSALLGAPLSAFLFTFEMRHFKDFKNVPLLLVTLLAALVAHQVSLLIGLKHSAFFIEVPPEESFWVYMLVAGFLSGLAAHFFYWGLKGYTKLISHLIHRIEVKLFIGGLLVSVLVYFTQGYEYVGIGVSTIEKSFTTSMSFYDFIMKALLTILTIAVGFKGGEMTPLLFMGATLSNAGLHSLGFHHYALSSSLGMVSLFGAVSGAPLASALICFELFGWHAGLLSLGSCLLARLIMGKRSVYRH